MKQRKWYKNPTVISAIIAGVFTVIAAVAGALVDNFYFWTDNDAGFNGSPPDSEHSADIFWDDFEKNLSKWEVENYSGYNNFMIWHISSKKSSSGENSLAIGNEETDQKDNADTIRIETQDTFSLSENSYLEFNLLKSHEINFQVFLAPKDSNIKKKIKFFPGNIECRDWKEEEIPLFPHKPSGEHRIVLEAWGKGSLYIDDFRLTTKNL